MQWGSALGKLWAPHAFGSMLLTCMNSRQSQNLRVPDSKGGKDRHDQKQGRRHLPSS